MSTLVPESDLETALAAVEHRLSALGMALCVRDTVGIDTHATELHRALAMAVDQFANAARRGSVPPALRHRRARPRDRRADAARRRLAVLDHRQCRPRSAGQLGSRLSAGGPVATPRGQPGATGANHRSFASRTQASRPR